MSSSSGSLPALGTGGRVMLASLRSGMFGRDVAETSGGFRLVRRIGSGAHGDVYEAADDELDRHVALKVLRRSGADEGDVLARRLLREARALARLNHPNVVEVFGAGIDGERIWIAMELVRGTTLRQWASEHPVRSPEDGQRTLALLLQAARGLAAAHRHGILHRDFKPANALLGDDGRLRVADFGLARWDDEPDDFTTERAQSLTSGESERLTGARAVLGTPRYMSPEQAIGAELDARSDQYNFGVAAWELLTGVPPSGTDDPVAMPATSVAPAFVFRALRRSLRREPSRRFATMDAMVAALSRPPFGAGWVAAGVLGLGALVTIPVLRTAEDRPECSASQAAEELQVVWNPERRAEVAEGLHQTAVPYADRAFGSVAAAIDGYVAQWTEQHVAVCRAAWYEGTSTEAELDAGMRCLRDDLRTVDGLLARLDSARPDLAERAAVAAASLPAPSRCAGSPGQAGGDDPLPADVRADLADAQAAALAGDDPTAEALAERVVAYASDPTVPRALGDALEVSGQIGATRREDRGYDQLKRAHELAASEGDDRRAYRRARMVARAAATLTRFEDASDYLRHSEAALARIAATADEQTQLAVAKCWVTQKASGSAAALPACEVAAELAASDEVSPRTRRDALSFHATVLSTLGHLDEAEAKFQALRAEATEALGPGHPATARVVKNLAYVSARGNESDQAIARLVEYIGLMEAARGPGDESLPVVCLDLGNFYVFARRFDEAEEAFATAMERIDAHEDLDPTKRKIERARAQGYHARMVRTRGDGARAVQMLRSAVSETDTTLPEDHWLTTSNRLELGVTLLYVHEYQEASEILAAVAESLSAAKHPRESEARVHLGLALEGLARWAEARAAYRRVIALAGDEPTPHRWAATAHLAWIAARLGELDAARAHLAAIDAADRGTLGVYVRSIASLADAELSWSAGNRSQALQTMDSVLATLAEDTYPGAGPADALAQARRRRACLVEPTGTECGG